MLPWRIPMVIPVRRPARPKAKRRLAGITEAADYANVSARTVRRYVADGRLTGFRVGLAATAKPVTA
jgi:hypothetical protein